MVADKRILIIDDEKLIVKATGLVIRLAGYEVLSSYNGEDGLVLAQESKPDLILLDIMMPGMDGWQVLEKLKSNPETAAIPVVIFTAKEYIRGKQMSRDAGAADYITKPFEATDLMEMIQRHVSARPDGGDSA